jgi:hypothetical protein
MIPVVEYHYPGYSDGNVALPPEFYDAQIKYFKDNGYCTLSDKDLAQFLDGSKAFPAKSVVLRIDQSVANFDKFEEMVGKGKTCRNG